MRFSRVFLYLLFAAYDPTYLVNVLTFVHPDWGMLIRSRRVLIFFTHYVEQHSRAELQLRTIYIQQLCPKRVGRKDTT